MPIIKEPRPLPSDLLYVPSNSMPYQVTNGDSWRTLAMRPDVKLTGMHPYDLCYFNFKTRTPSEINWYLHNKVGCKHVTRDGYNYMFSTADRPGIIYLPNAGPPAPVHEIQPKKQEIPLNAWLGVATKAGTTFAVVGIETIAGYVVSLDDIGKGMGITASVNRAGLGWGATGGFCFVFITGVKSPERLNGYQQLDKDFNLALGENWGKMAKSAKGAKKFQPLAEALMKIGAKTPSDLKKILKTEPDKYFELVKAAKSVRDYGELKRDGETEVFMWDIPWGSWGIEASAFYGLANFNAVWDHTD